MLVKKYNQVLRFRFCRNTTLIKDEVIIKICIKEGFKDITKGDSYGIASPENI